VSTLTLGSSEALFYIGCHREQKHGAAPCGWSRSLVTLYLHILVLKVCAVPRNGYVLVVIWIVWGVHTPKLWNARVLSSIDSNGQDNEPVELGNCSNYALHPMQSALHLCQGARYIEGPGGLTISEHRQDHTYLLEEVRGPRMLTLLITQICTCTCTQRRHLERSECVFRFLDNQIYKIQDWLQFLPVGELQTVNGFTVMAVLHQWGVGVLVPVTDPKSNGTLTNDNR
jgi:hypothetical protein